MLSDAELRELEIQNIRIEIERQEERLKRLIESKNSFDAGVVIQIIKYEKEKLAKLEEEAADELEMVLKLKDGDNNAKLDR